MNPDYPVLRAFGLQHILVEKVYCIVQLGGEGGEGGGNQCAERRPRREKVWRRAAQSIAGRPGRGGGGVERQRIFLERQCIFWKIFVRCAHMHILNQIFENPDPSQTSTHTTLGLSSTDPIIS